MKTLQLDKAIASISEMYEEEKKEIVRVVNLQNELLEALKVAKRYMVPGDKTVYALDIRKVENAIAKAEGK